MEFQEENGNTADGQDSRDDSANDHPSQEQTKMADSTKVANPESIAPGRRQQGSKITKRVIGEE